MRLTTLARKIKITPKQLIFFLNEKGIEVENGLHGKLDEDAAKMVLEHYSPEDIAETIEVVVAEESNDPAPIDSPTENINEVEDIGESTDKNPAEVAVSDRQASSTDLEADEVVPKVGTVEDLESEEFEKIELIKVKKVKLEGIKVVGKIDLPEKPKKAITENDEEVSGTDNLKQKTEKKAFKNKNSNREGKKSRQGKNRSPLTFEERLKEEEREKLKKRRRRENAEKRRKIKYYKEHIQPKTSQKSSKRNKSHNEAENKVRKQDIVVHKNPIKRFWAWLNGEYDRF